MRFTCYNDGFAVEPRDYGQTQGRTGPWQATIRLSGLGRPDGPALTLASARWAADGNTALVHADPVVVAYTNGMAGLRQTFRITDRASGTRPLQLDFTVECDRLQWQCSAAGDAIDFTDPSWSGVVRYWDLHAWDANGSTLPATMARLGPTRFAIVVEDEAATYPVVIDPLTSTWHGSATQSGEAFGFAVADPGGILGNGDYYGRIAIGAAEYDTGSLVDLSITHIF
jgi:hypothetical protein